MRILKLIAAALCAATLLTACKSASLETMVETSRENSRPESSPQISQGAPVSSTPEPIIQEPSPAPDYTAYEVYCVEENRILIGENIYRKVAPASLTKLLTASVALKYCSADEVVTVGTELELVQPESSLCLIKKGHRLTMYDLLTGLLLPSGNDAAYSIAVHVARKVSGIPELPDRAAVRVFCDLMNDFGEEIGLRNTHFVNPEGWDDPRHYTTASDLTKIAKYALSVPEIREIVATTKRDVTFVSGETITWYNGNMLLWDDEDFYCPDAIGMKTGFTDNAGRCLIAAFERSGKTYIITMLGCKDPEWRYNKVLELYRRLIVDN
ncbi:MAG: hypothetical protein K2J77_02215 [Oscillospiraceae bacterium]|nr:hypothetical protein [Oscillospiraceae bacterium]